MGLLPAKKKLKKSYDIDSTMFLLTENMK